MTKKPILRYSYRNPIVDPMDDNYKFARRLEMSIFGRKKIREYIMANFRPEKTQMIVEDLGTPETRANVVFYSYSGVEMYKLTTKPADVKRLKPATFEGIMVGVVKKHQKLLRDEVDEFNAWKKQQEKDAKKAEDIAED